MLTESLKSLTCLLVIFIQKKQLLKIQQTIIMIDIVATVRIGVMKIVHHVVQYAYQNVIVIVNYVIVRVDVLVVHHTGQTQHVDVNIVSVINILSFLYIIV